MQEALLALWSEPVRPVNPGAWLMRATVHRSLYLRRTRARCRRHEERAASRGGEPVTRDDPSLLLQERELQAALETAVGELPREYREVFGLRQLQRLGYDDIAARLDIPIGTVRSRLNRARGALQKALGPLLDGFDADCSCGRDGTAADPTSTFFSGEGTPAPPPAP